MKNYSNDVFSAMEKTLNDSNFINQFREQPLIKKEAAAPIEETDEQKLFKSAYEYLIYASSDLEKLGLPDSSMESIKSLAVLEAEFNKTALPDFEVEIPNQNEVDVTESDPELEVLDEILEVPEPIDEDLKDFDQGLEDLEFDNKLTDLLKEIDQDESEADDSEEINPNFEPPINERRHEPRREKLNLSPESDWLREDNWFDEEDDDTFTDIDKLLGVNQDSETDPETQSILDFEREFDRTNRLDREKNPREVGTRVERKR